MILIAVIKTILTLGFGFVLFLLWRGNKGTLKQSGIPVLIAVFLLAAVIAWIGSGFVPEKKDQILIEATGEKNEAAKGNEIYLTCVRDGDEIIDFEVDGSDRWYWTGSWYTWRNELDPRRPAGVTDQFTMELPLGTDRTIEFFTNRYKGVVRVRQGDTSFFVDCYSEEDGRLKVAVADSPQSALAAAVLVPLGVFTGAFWVCMLLAAAASFFFSKKRNHKYKKSTGKATGAGAPIRAGKKTATLDDGNANRIKTPLFSKKNAVPLICICVLSLGLALLIHPSISGPREYAVVSAMQYQNKNSLSASVTFRNVTVNGSGKPVEIRPIGAGEETGQALVNYYNAGESAASTEIMISLPVGKNRAVGLQKNDASGYAVLSYDNQLWVQDCYSEEDSFIHIRIPDSPRKLLQQEFLLNLAMVCCVFIPLCAVLGFLYWRLLTRYRDRLTNAANKAWTRILSMLQQDDVVWARRICLLLFIVAVLTSTIIFVLMQI